MNASSVKVLPNIEEIITSHGYNFSTELDDITLAWVKHLNKTWTVWKKSDTFQQTLQKFFDAQTDPFSTTLAIIVAHEDFKDCKPKTLPYCITDCLNIWSKHKTLLPSDDIKVIAFIIASQQRSQTFFNLTCETFSITLAYPKVVPFIDKMINNGSYKQALQSVIALGTTENISFLEILMPLLVQDKTSMLDEYFTQFPDHVEPFVIHIDSLLDRSINLTDYFQNYVYDKKLQGVKWEKLYYKPLGKLVARLCSKHNIQLSLCKNLYKNRANGMLRFLVHQKYQEKKVGDTAWEDMVSDTLKQHPDSVNEFIETLSDYDPKEALKWLNNLDLSLDSYPYLARYMSDQQQSSSCPENWDLDDPEPAFYKLPIPPSTIKLVNNINEFNELVSTDLSKQSVVALDSEWKPTFGVNKKTNVALIQLATYSNIYLIDVTALNKPEYASYWTLFLKQFLENQDVIKLGFGMENDLREIKKSVIGLQNLKLKSNCFLDLAILWKSLSTAKVNLPHQGEVSGASLSSLVQCCFGQSLDKKEQFSNWESRPLRDTQIEYAALDAYVLLTIYDLMQESCKKVNVNFEEICNNIII